MWRAALALLLVVLFSVAAPGARAGDVDYAGFKTAVLEGTGLAVDAQIAKLEAELAAEDRPDVRAELGKALAELKLFKKRVEDVATAEALWDSIKNAQTALAELAKETEVKWGGSVHMGIVNAQEVSKVAKATEVAGKAIDYGWKLKKLGDDLGAIESADLSPATKKLSKSLSVMAAILATFGDKAPLVGSLLKGYGDLTAELLKSTLALDAKIEAREGGQMIDGVHGDRGYMLDRLRERKIDNAQRVTGLRDVFRADDGRFLIWDRAARDWVIASEWEPGLTADELTKRYVYFAKRGITEPTPEQVVRGYRKVIVLELVPSVDHVAPGATVTLRVKGRLIHDNAEIEQRELYATVTLVDHTGIGEGTLANAERVKIGESASWTAPNNLNETYNFSVDLAEETAKVALSAGAATATVRTGAETRVELVADTYQAAAGQPVVLTAKLVTMENNYLPPTVAGSIDLTADPALGLFTEQAELTDVKGATYTWIAPDQAGEYTFTARYGGATAYGMFGQHTAAGEGTVTITVGAPQDAGVDSPPEDAADPDDAAEEEDAAEVASGDPDAAELDWPGTWKGKFKTTVAMDGANSTSTEDVTLEIRVAPDNTIRLVRAGFPEVTLERTPSNPRAATGSGDVPRPPNTGPGQVLSWKAAYKITTFLAGGKLNVAIHLTIDQTVAVPDMAPQSSNFVSDSIGVLDKIR